MKVEIRDNSILIDGYINVVGRDSRELRDASGKFIEQIAPGTFAEALASGHDVELRVNHQKVIGGTNEGLNLREDNVGLRGTVEVSDAEVIKMARNNELRGWSFGFICKEDSWENRADGTRHRTISKLDLREVSILNKTPAYIATSIEARDSEEILIEFRAEEAENISVSEAEKGEKRDQQQEEEKTADIELKKLKLRLLKLGRR